MSTTVVIPPFAAARVAFAIGLPPIPAEDVEVLVDEPGQDRQPLDVQRLLSGGLGVYQRRDLPIADADVHALDDPAWKHDLPVDQRQVMLLGHRRN